MPTAAVIDRRIDRPRWATNAPFWGVHVAALVGAVWIGWSWAALAWLAGGYLIRMFGVTAGYHRYFAHRSYKTSRGFQFVLALLGMSAAQQGPLWWAAHHRRHHKFSDEVEDVHSPRQRGFYWSHIGWILSSRHVALDADRIKDFSRYPELRFLNRHDLMFVIVLGVLTFAIGGATGLVWGMFVPTVLCWHMTFCINSLAHVWGNRRYATSDDSRNNPLLALVTLGEGWHNNHHHYQRSTRQGFYWWELDLAYVGIKALEAMRLVRDVTTVPRGIRDAVAP
ncbi:MAG TPA: acyl-CoA desaturase [Kofleriaceae bacterium]|nr:acyl-CoA desaturase [Kofleriaceae bacterium]